MINFSISTQIINELEEFTNSSIRLANVHNPGSVKTLQKGNKGSYMYNQMQTIGLIDLYHNSKFESGELDSSGKRKMFMNVGKFRTDVSAKQIDIDVKDIRFIPDDYANPWPSFFLQKQFKEYAKESYFGELLNDLVENYPKYGSVVLKKVNGKMEFLPLQVLRNEQSAKSLKEAKYVIEEHEDMSYWDIEKYKNWNMDGFSLKYDETTCVYERYGYVPRSWLESKTKEPMFTSKDTDYVNALVIVAFDKSAKSAAERREHVFYAQEMEGEDRPYEEAHWSRQHGRWLGVGVMEEQIPNQIAKNIIINLLRKGLEWSSKHVFQTARQDVAQKNLATSVVDGQVIEVGPNGNITPVSLESRNIGEYQNMLSEWDKNSDQKAFTYEVATGESMSSGTPFRLGVILSNAVNTFFNHKREKLGLFVKRAIQEFLLKDFIKEIGNKDQMVAMYSDEPGYEAVKVAAMDLAKSEAIRISLLNGQPVDAASLEQAIEPYKAIDKLIFNIPAGWYKTVKYKTEITVTGEEIDLQKKVESLITLFQIFQQSGDPRAQKVLERISGLIGEDLATFAVTTGKVPNLPQQQQQVNPQQLTPNAGQPTA